MRQTRDFRRGVIPALALTIALLAWIAGSQSGEVRGPMAPPERHHGTAVESAITLLVVTSDRPRIPVAASRHGKAQLAAALMSVPSVIESPGAAGTDVAPASALVSIGPLGAGLTRRGPPVGASG